MTKQAQIKAAYQAGRKAWQQVSYGLVWEWEALADCPDIKLDRLGYAAWRKGYEEARERTTQQRAA
jgi:hypothetical protein